MKQPQRLMHNGSPSARALLASLDEDVPPDPAGAQERILRALDVPGRTSGAVVEPPPARSRRWAPIATVCGLVVACVTVFTVAQRGASSRAGVPEPAVVATPVAPVATAAAAESAAPIEELPPIDVHALASAPNEGAPHAPRIGVRRDLANAPAPSSTSTTASDPSDELQLLERAQAAAARGQGDEALALVARHRREFPRGRFGVEMSVVEIEALARAGRLDEAAAGGERFLERHPGSPYTRRVEAVVRTRGEKEQTR